MCDVCSTGTERYGPYEILVHTRPGLAVNRTEIRPREGAPPLVWRDAHALCPRCDGALVRR